MTHRWAIGMFGAVALVAATASGQVDPTDAGIRTLEVGESASVALKAFSRSGEEIIHGGERSITVDAAFQSIGPLLGGPDVVEARWSEIRGMGTNVLQFEFRSRDGSPLVPADYLIDGEEAAFIGWEIGRSNPIEFLDFTGDINVTEYKVFVSENRGIDFQVYDLTSSFLNPWDGVDFGRTLPLRTPGGPVEYNLMIVEYEYTYTIPAPATLTLLGGMGLVGFRRRR